MRASFNNIIALLVVVSVGMGAIFLVALEHIAGAVWSVPFRRIAEHQGFIFLATPLLAIPIIFNMHDIFEWTHNSVVLNDPILYQKSPYLNTEFFIARSVGVFVLMTFFLFVYLRNSTKQDTTHSQKTTKINALISAPFMVFFAIGITLIAIDYAMSLEPHWFSTIFGVYYFAGTFATAMAVLTLITLSLKSNGNLLKEINRNHYYSMGGLMFAFTAFWMYMAFSQYMLIWYANIPEETFWFLPRMENGWEYLSIALILIKFIIPFGLLLNRNSKMNPSRLKLASFWIIGAHIYDMYWLVMPSYNRMSGTEGPVFGWIELSFIALSAGIILVFYYLAARNKNHIPIGDPKLNRALDFHI
ncbi:MAG: quinol:cytochrome C oxidoreductase [Ignavibacteriae bacterium]|nr:quinol:cytochrome C oxidoreductase [Ignavibacteriota bacterium]MCB9220282.1 quinol:cytochrome C oxidoreductase [Ignavibacteria bacterium]